MRAPPPASIECVTGRGWRVVQAVLHGLAAGAMAMWFAQQFGFAHASAASLLSAVAGCAWGWKRSAAAQVRLRWDGVNWALCRPAAPELLSPPPSVALDLGTWMLLRCKPIGAPVQWLSAARHSAGPGWLPFRAAVYSSVSVPTSSSPSELPPF